jgi:type IV secretion system protein TrbL
MKLPKPRKATCAALAVIGLLLVPELAQAAANTGIMDSVMNKYHQVASTWGSKMVAYGGWIFWGLALISMVWTYGMMFLRKADIGEFFAETIRFFGTLGFFYWILLNGPAISNAIIRSMWQMGAAAVGGGAKFTPSGITDIGFNIFFKAIDESSRFSPVDSAAAIVLSGAVLVVLALVAVNMLLLFVSAWILMYGGVVFLGFGGSRWTSDIAITYYKTVLGIGAQLMGMVLLVGIGKTFIDQAYLGMSKGVNLKELGVLAITAIVLLYLTNKIPPMLAGIVGGASTGGVGSYGAGAAMGAAVAAAGIAAGVASAGASMALGGAANMAGAGNALRAAFQSAQENMSSSSGGDGDTGNAGSPGSDGGSTGNINGSDGGSGGGGGGSGSGSSFGQAMGTAGRFASDMGSSLISGAASGLSAKASSIAAAANERISNTAGGKLAAEIDGSAGQARADAQTMERAGKINQGKELQEARNMVANHDNPTPATEPEFKGDSISSGRPDIDAFINGKA